MTDTELDQKIDEIRRIAEGLTQIQDILKKCPKLRDYIHLRYKHPGSRMGGEVGGYARAASMTPEARRACAKKAAQARWHKKKSQIGWPLPEGPGLPDPGMEPVAHPMVPNPRPTL